MKKLVLLLTMLFALCPSLAGAFDYAYASNGYKYVVHRHNESSYQHAWCSMHHGIEEYENRDKTRVDCLTATHAVEFDFANKWAESIGQALHYQRMTGKRAKVVLILEKPKKQMVYYWRVFELGKLHDFDVEYVTPAILQLKNGKCSYIDCKCNRKLKKSNKKKH